MLVITEARQIRPCDLQRRVRFKGQNVKDTQQVLP